MPDIEHKNLEIKALTSEGQVEAVISTFGMDRDGDVMTREAFAGSMGKTIPMVWSHDWTMPIGKGLVTVDGNGAKLTGQFFMETQDGLEAYKRVKAMGALQEYSIGFRIKEADFGYQENDSGDKVFVRTIKDLELFEASPVLVGAAYGTGTVAIKGAQKAEKAFETLKNALKATDFKAITVPDELEMTVDALLDVIENAADALEAIFGTEDEPEEMMAARVRDRLEKALKRLPKTVQPGISAPSEPVIPASETERKLKDLEAALGYRPLIADKVY